MDDAKSAAVSIPALARDSESIITLLTKSTPNLAVLKARRSPHVGNAKKARELARLATIRLRVLINEGRSTRKPLSQTGLVAYNYVEPLLNCWGANSRVLITQCLGRVEAQDAFGSVSELINGASHNYAGFYKATPEAEELQRMCLEMLPVSDSNALPLLRDETHRVIARFLGSDFCCTTSTGYGSNYIALPALIDGPTLVIMDEDCHNSMFTGVFLGPSSNLKRFRHNNMEHLEILLSGCVDDSVDIIVAIEGLYSTHGDVPPLADIHRLKKRYRFVLYCNEAHSFLSLGKTGRGCLEFWNDSHPEKPLPWDLIDIRTGTLSKVVGGMGGMITGKKRFENALRKHISNLDDKSNVSLSSSTMVQTLWLLGQPYQIKRNLRRLTEITHFCRKELGRFGIFVYGDAGIHVLPIYTGRPTVAAKLSYALRRHGLLATPVCTPAVPFWESRVRVNLSADFTDEEVDRLVDAVIRAAAHRGLCKTAGIARNSFKGDAHSFLIAEGFDEATKVSEHIQKLIKRSAAGDPASRQRQIFDKTCGSRVIQAGHASRAQYGIGAGGARLICGTFPPHIAVESLIAQATGMEAGLIYADASIGLASTIAAISRPLLGHRKNYMVFERGASQFVRDGLAMAPKKDGPVLLGYLDLFQLVEQVKKLVRGIEKLCMTVYIRVRDDSPHDLLSATLAEIAALVGSESVMTILLHCTLQSLNPGDLVLLPAQKNVHILMCGSFSCLFGLPTGFVSGTESLVRELRYTSRGYTFTTSPPPFIMDMLRTALESYMAIDERI
ncbi:aminotransferase class I and II [Colletotrichum sublineola]|nr:aminotransferase class I and II [Colletotrichum sublineola]